MKTSFPPKLPPPRFHHLTSMLDSVSTPLGDLCTRLWSHPNLSDTSAISIGTTLAALLQDNLLPSPPHRLVAIYILYDMLVTPHPTPLSPPPSSAVDRLISSPLTAILFNLLDSGDSRPPEQLFLTHLLSHAQSTGVDTVPVQIAGAAAVALYNALQGALQSGASVPKLNMSVLRRSWAEAHPIVPKKERLMGISGVVLDVESGNGASKGNIALADELGEVVGLEEFAPQFVRLAPPMLPVEDSELKWVDPEVGHEVVWDGSMGIGIGGKGREVREVIARALKGPIGEGELKMVVGELEGDARLVHLCGMTPANLPDLVLHNSQLATEVLFKLVGSNLMPAYLSALVGMEVNKHSMEVVSRLTDSVELPGEVLHTYISHCIRSCGNIADKYDQIRMVRFVCVFLKRIMKNNVIDAQDLLIEVQAFCIDNSRIREVADLFRSLKMQ